MVRKILFLKESQAAQKKSKEQKNTVSNGSKKIYLLKPEVMQRSDLKNTTYFMIKVFVWLSNQFVPFNHKETKIYFILYFVNFQIFEANFKNSIL